MAQVSLMDSQAADLAELERLIRCIPAWVQVCTLDGVVELANERAASIAGLSPSEMVGHRWPYPWLSDIRWSDCPLPGSSDPAYTTPGWDYQIPVWPEEHMRSGGGPRKFEAICGMPGQKQRALEITLSTVQDEPGVPQRVMMVGWDVTERQIREEDLGQLQKMQLVSQLASGVAHDINNNLAVILGYAEFLLTTCDSLERSVQEALAAIQEQSEACADTVRRIQLFSRPVPKSKLSCFPVNDVIQEAVKQSEPVWKRAR